MILMQSLIMRKYMKWKHKYVNHATMKIYSEWICDVFLSCFDYRGEYLGNSLHLYNSCISWNFYMIYCYNALREKQVIVENNLWLIAIEAVY